MNQQSFCVVWGIHKKTKVGYFLWRLRCASVTAAPTAPNRAAPGGQGLDSGRLQLALQRLIADGVVNAGPQL